jgi:CRISPR system Cascade subunit CasE
MYLSQLLLDLRSRDVLADLSDPYQLHRTVMSGFPTQAPVCERVLFRLEIQRREPPVSLLVQSQTAPDWAALERRGYLLRPAVVKTFTPSFSTGQLFRFRLAANPTKRLHGDGEKDGPRVGLMYEDDQLAWLQRKGELHGFQVLSAQTAKIVQPDGWKCENGKKHRIRQLGVRFDGVLEVCRPDEFDRALAGGVGSGKGFGFGLLSLAPVD